MHVLRSKLLKQKSENEVKVTNKQTNKQKLIKKTIFHKVITSYHTCIKQIILNINKLQ